MVLTFYETVFFTRRAAELMDDKTYRHLQNDLLRQPTKGEVMCDCGGIRKIRLSSAKCSKGKRGGLHLIYLYIPEAQPAFISSRYTVKRNGMTFTPHRNGIWQTLPDKSSTYCRKNTMPKRIEYG